jgi:hypothetical protein
VSVSEEEQRARMNERRAGEPRRTTERAATARTVGGDGGGDGMSRIVSEEP